MSKLIGTNPNQVPSNADLGTAAFMDKKELLLSKGSSLSAIDAIVDKTAIRVFVYDTRKDSDGGAWRKRTQHTSWYNERLNTVTRGSRKEFPAVAVIVIESTKVTIYDGDDLNMPMWMVFEQSGYGNMLGESNNNAVAMLNARIALGCNPYDLYVVDFLKDSGWSHSNNVVISGTYFGNISQRNIGNGQADADSWTFGTVPNIINRTVNDVAMTVLPNAPIDTTTGLLVPTIAVGTAGGTSIIKDDGSIVDITWSNGSHSNLVTFIDNKVFIAHDFSGAVARHGHLFNIPQSDLAEGAYYSKGSAVEFYGPSGFKLAPRTESYVNITEQAGPAFGYAGYLAKYSGLAFLERNESDYTRSSVANITTEYNTGYMVGGIKLATLSDTDDTNVTGSELVTNGTFDSNITGWVASDAGCSLSLVSNKLRISNNDQSAGGAVTSFSVVAGETYCFSVGTSSADVWLYLGASVNTATYFGPIVSNTTTWKSTVTGTVYFMIKNSSTSNGNTIDIDNISVRLAEEDRSVNGNGLQVFGTVPKTPVATGADLVAYGPFTASNYLEQPYNSDLDFGTGDFMYSMWIYRNSLPTSSYERWFGTVASNGEDRIDIFSNANTDNIAFYSFDASGIRGDIRITGIGIGVWHCFHFTRQGRDYKIYHNGELRGTNVGSATLANYAANTDRRTHIGAAEHWDTGKAVLDGKIALAKISGTVPSSEQIRKIYQEEKMLFQENAKATLYGTSDTVTAVAYDDDTKLIHAGTSAGRSVFQGLRRIDNTTDAVSIDISASNGMVVEE